MTWTHGGNGNSVVTDSAGNTLADYPVAVWDSAVGGSMVSDLTEIDGVTPIASLRTDPTGPTAGRIRRVQSASHPLMWWAVTDAENNETRWASIAEEVVTRANTAYQTSQDNAVAISAMSNGVNLASYLDGSGDDWQAFHDAMADAATANPAPIQTPVYVAAGAYNVSATVTVPSNVALVTDSAPHHGPTVSITATAAMDAVIADEAWTTGDTSRGMVLKGIHADAAGLADYGIVTASGGCRILWCSVEGYNTAGFYAAGKTKGGTAFSNLHEQRYLDCRVEAGSGDGFYADVEVLDGYLRELICNNAGGDGIHLERATGWNVTGCHVTNAQDRFIYANNIWQTRITGNYLDNLGQTTTGSTQYGIMATASGPGVISGNGVNINSAASDTCVGFDISSCVVTFTDNFVIYHTGNTATPYAVDADTGSRVENNIATKDGDVALLAGGTQAGTVDVDLSATSTASVTFDVPFLDVPRVVPSVAHTQTAASVSSVTKTGFTVTVASTDGTSPTFTETVDWLAVG